MVTGPLPVVSVVMPVHNGEAYLREALQSVLGQTFGRLQLIVVDDGSQDGCRGVVQAAVARDPRVHYVYQENRGVSDARNRGIAAGSAPLIAFLDQDDRWTPDALELQVAYHRLHPEVLYTLAHQTCFLAQGCPVPAWFGSQKLDEPRVGYLPGTLAVKRELFDRLGCFDTRYPISGDADWFARARDANIPTHTLPQVILERRIHEGNQSRFSRQIQRELFKLLKASIGRKRRADHESSPD